MTFLSAGRVDRGEGFDRARNAVKGLMAMAPRRGADVKQPDGSWNDARRRGCPWGIVQVKPSERLALDGVVVAGESSINQAPVTGESVPVDKEGGRQRCSPGTINESGVSSSEPLAAKDRDDARQDHPDGAGGTGEPAPTRFVDKFAGSTRRLCASRRYWSRWCRGSRSGSRSTRGCTRRLVLLVIACPCAGDPRRP